MRQQKRSPNLPSSTKTPSQTHSLSPVGRVHSSEQMPERGNPRNGAIDMFVRIVDVRAQTQAASWRTGNTVFPIQPIEELSTIWRLYPGHTNSGTELCSKRRYELRTRFQQALL